MTEGQDPFEPPRSELRKPSSGSGLERALRGEYVIDLPDILQEATERCRGQRLWILGALLIVVAIQLGMQEATTRLGFDPEPFLLAGDASGAVRQMVLASLITLPFSVCFNAGLFLLTLKRGYRIPVEFGELFRYFSFALPLTVTALMVNFATLLGFLLLILPGLYIGVVLWFAAPLVVIHEMSPWMAIRASWTALSHQALRAGLVIACSIAVSIAGLLLCGVGLIWLGPISMMMLAVLYARVFGLDGVAELTDEAAGA